MDFGKAFTFAFKSEQWFLNCLFMALASLIPVIGYIVLFGYLAELLSHRLVEGKESYWDFDWSRFGEYVTRGLPTFILYMVFNVAVFVLMFVGMIIFAIVAGAVGAAAGSSGNPEAGIIMIPVMFVFFVAIFAVSIGSAMLMIPLSLKGMLTGQIGDVFDFSFAISFLKLTFFSLILGILLLYVISLVYAFIGFLALCIGIFITSMMSMCAMVSMFEDVYIKYLQRGGDPVEVMAPVAK